MGLYVAVYDTTTIGFERNNSTDHAIIQLVDDISNAFENGEFTLGAFIDLSKAVDTFFY